MLLPMFYLAGRVYRELGQGLENICSALRTDNLLMLEFTVNPDDKMIKLTGLEDRFVLKGAAD